MVVLSLEDGNEPARYRGWVEKLLVSPAYRRMGVARGLMGKLEEVAKGKGLGLLVSLDLEVWSWIF